MTPHLALALCELALLLAARFDEAVRLAEAAFAGEFSGLLTHLCERLSGAADGRRSSAIRPSRTSANSSTASGG